MKEECNGCVESLGVPDNSHEHPQLPGQQENPGIWGNTFKTSAADLWYNVILSEGCLPHTLLWKATGVRMHMMAGVPRAPSSSKPWSSMGPSACVPQAAFGTLLQYTSQCFGQFNLK